MENNPPEITADPLEQLPVYRCHKEVHASKILEIKQSPPDVVVEGGSYDIVCEHTTVTVPAAFIDEKRPQVGGYFVAYADDYVSYSPAKAFEDGYTILDDIRYQPTDAVEREKLQKCAERLIELEGLPRSNGMTFGEAIESLKRGNRVARAGWNGKGMWLSLQVPDEHSKMQHPYVFMSDAAGKLFPWNPNNLDMLASDWQEV